MVCRSQTTVRKQNRTSKIRNLISSLRFELVADTHNFQIWRQWKTASNFCVFALFILFSILLCPLCIGYRLDVLIVRYLHSFASKGLLDVVS